MFLFFFKGNKAFRLNFRSQINQANTFSVNRLPVDLSIFCALFFCVSSNAQNYNDSKEHYLFFDEITGIENSDLHVGVIYEEEHRVKNKSTKFFPKPDFVSGSVVFNKLPYFEIPLKYNVYDDELLMLVDKQFGGDLLQLHKKQVNNFKIGNHFFIKIDNTDIPAGFYERVMEKTFFSLFTKHRKTLKQQLGEKLVFYEFKDARKQCFLLYQKSYHSIEKLTDLISIFPKYETELHALNENIDPDLPFDIRLESFLEYLDKSIVENDKM